MPGAQPPTNGGTNAAGSLGAAPLRILSDEGLARLAAVGNRAAFALIYERHAVTLLAYCRSITRDADGAADALQSAMTKALASLRKGGERPRVLRAWLYRIAHNEAVTVLRQRRSLPQPTDLELDSSPALATNASPEVRGRLRDLLEDLGALSERRRAALLMRELCGLSYQEIGVALSCSEQAARQSVFEARGALTDLSGGRESSCDTVRRKISDGDRRLLRARRVRAHLRHCEPCRSYDAALTTRRRGLTSLFPAIPAGGAVASLNAALAGGGSAGGLAAGGGAIVGGTAAVGLGTKAALAGVAALAAAGAVAMEAHHVAGGADGAALNGHAAKVAAASQAVRAMRPGAAAQAVADAPAHAQPLTVIVAPQHPASTSSGGASPADGPSLPAQLTVADAGSGEATNFEGTPTVVVSGGSHGAGRIVTPATPAAPEQVEPADEAVAPAAAAPTASAPAVPNPVQQAIASAQQITQQATAAAALQWQQQANTIAQQAQASAQQAISRAQQIVQQVTGHWMNEP